MQVKASIIPEINAAKVVIVGQNEKHFQQVKWQIKQHPGHTVFEINIETGDVTPAKYEEAIKRYQRLKNYKPSTQLPSITKFCHLVEHMHEDAPYHVFVS